MSIKTLNQITIVGFLLLSFAVLGSMVILVVPLLEDYRPLALWYLVLPAGVTGIALIAFEKMQTAPKE